MSFRPGFSMACGVECSGGRLTVVRSRRRAGGVEHEVLARDMDPVNDPAWSAIASELTAGQQSGAAPVVAAAYAQDVFIRPMEAPFASRKKAQAIFPSLLDVQLPFPLEQCVYHFVPVESRVADRIQAVALAMPKDRLQRTLEENRSFGIDPERLEPEAIALWRFNQGQFPPISPRPRVLIHLAADRTVAVIGRAGMPTTAFSARMAWTDAAMQAKLCARLQPFLAGALRGDGDGAPEFFISGGGAPAGSDSLRESLGIEPALWRGCDQPETVLARALAGGCLYSDPWSVNLREGAWIHPRAQQRAEGRRTRAFAAMAGAALVLMAAAAGASALVKRQHDRLQQMVQREAADLTGLPVVPRGQELFVVRQSMTAQEDRYASFQAWREPSVFPLFNQWVQAAHSRGMTLEMLAVRAGGVLARGSGSDWNDTDYLTRPLSQQGWKLEVERGDAGLDERVHFTVRAQP